MLCFVEGFWLVIKAQGGSLFLQMTLNFYFCFSAPPASVQYLKTMLLNINQNWVFSTAPCAEEGKKDCLNVIADPRCVCV